MSIRAILLLIAGFTFCGLTNAQVYYSLTVYVEDTKTQKPLKGATITIKELSFQTKTTGSDGKVFFQDVPVGEIHYFVACDDYSGKEGTFNISSKEDDNTLKLGLLSANFSPSMILVSGEVVNTEGMDVEGAIVELVVGNVVKINTTNRSGIFNIELNLDEVTYNVTEFRLEVTKGDCMEKTTFAIPKNNYIYKEIKMSCSVGGTPSTTTIPDPVNKIEDCQVNYTGDYCFSNNSSVRVDIRVYKGSVPTIKDKEMTLNAGQTQCLYGLSSRVYNYDIIKRFPDGKADLQRGQIKVEMCKSGSFTIK